MFVAHARRLRSCVALGIVARMHAQSDAGRRARWELIGAAALFSTGGAAIKACSLGGWQVAGLRSFVAVFAFLALVRASRRMPRPREWLVGAAYAACLVAFVVSNKLTTAADAIFLQSASPVYMLLLAPLLLGERIRGRDLAFMAVLACGIGAFFLDQIGGAAVPAQATAPNVWLGRVVALGSGVAWAFTMLGLRWLGANKAAGESGAASAVLAGNVLAALACLCVAGPHVELGARDLAIVLWLGVFQIALAYKLVTQAVTHVPAFEASVLLLVEPVFNPLWAWLVHGERPTPWALVGGAIILTATLAKTWFDARSRAEIRSP